MQLTDQLVKIVVAQCAYLSSCHRTVSDANCWTLRTLFISMTTPRLEEFSPALEFPLISNVSVDFFEFLPTEFAACSKPPSKDNYRKAFYPRM